MHVLLVDYLVVYGTELIGKIRGTILGSDLVKKVVFNFLLKSTEYSVKFKVLDFIVSVYSRMRGKDFCFKLLSKGSTLEVTTRQTQAVLANPKHRPKKETKTSNKMWEFVLTVVNEVIEIIPN